MTREEAIGYLKSADVTVGREPKTKTAEALEIAIKALKQEPCDDTEKNTGHWIYKTVRGVEVPCCSRCGLDNGTYYEFNFCPECGANMIEPQESEEV